MASNSGRGSEPMRWRWIVSDTLSFRSTTNVHSWRTLPVDPTAVLGVVPLTPIFQRIVPFPVFPLPAAPGALARAANDRSRECNRSIQKTSQCQLMGSYIETPMSSLGRPLIPQIRM